MKKLMLLVLALTSVMTLTACPDKKKGGGAVHVTTPTSCNNYRFNNTIGGFEDPSNPGRVVTCDRGPYGSTYNNAYAPYNQFIGGQQINSCSSWSQVYPGNIYVPVRTDTYGIVCVNVNTFIQVPQYSQYQSYYQTYPSHALSCRYGFDCPSSCVGGQGSMTIGVSTPWLGGSLALCFE